MTDSGPKKERSGTASAPKSDVFAKRMLAAVNFFVETNRLEPYTAVYLIAIKGWNEISFGIVSLVMNVVMIAFQTPAGDLLDKTKKKKKLITMTSILIASLTTVLPVWTSNFWAILVGKTIEGISATIFLPALMALLLGICQTEAEVPSFIAITELSNKIGSCFFVCGSAAISYYAYPNVESMFYLLGAGGLAAVVFTLLIPESDIDHDRARQLGDVPEVENGDDCEDEDDDSDYDEGAIEAFARRISTSSSFLVVGSSSEERRAKNSTTRDVEDGTGKSAASFRDGTGKSAASFRDGTGKSAASFRSNRSSFMISGNSSFMVFDSSISETRSQNLSTIGDEKTEPSRYLDLLKSPSIIFFAVLTFFYHLANAGVVPLLAQYLAITSSVRASLAWTSALLLYFYFFQAITSYIMIHAIDRFPHKNIMMVAFLVLPIRCASIAILIAYWNNPWALAATSAFEGIGAGVYDTMLPIIVKKLTEGSGRFGFTFGFIVTCWRMGHGVSVLFGETMVHSFGYTVAFIVLGCVGVLNLLGFAFFYSIDSEVKAGAADLEKKEVKHEIDETHVSYSTPNDLEKNEDEHASEALGRMEEEEEVNHLDVVVEDS
jgi:MFS family permease